VGYNCQADNCYVEGTVREPPHANGSKITLCDKHWNEFLIFASTAEGRAIINGNLPTPCGITEKERKMRRNRAKVERQQRKAYKQAKKGKK